MWFQTISIDINEIKYRIFKIFEIIIQVYR